MHGTSASPAIALSDNTQSDKRSTLSLPACRKTSFSIGHDTCLPRRSMYVRSP